MLSRFFWAPCPHPRQKNQQMTSIQAVKMVVQSPSKLKCNCKKPKLGSGEPLFSAASAHWPENLIFAFNQTATSSSLQDICIKIRISDSKYNLEYLGSSEWPFTSVTVDIVEQNLETGYELQSWHILDHDDKFSLVKGLAHSKQSLSLLEVQHCKQS